jgi:hypothetical protein
MSPDRRGQPLGRRHGDRGCAAPLLMSKTVPTTADEDDVLGLRLPMISPPPSCRVARPLYQSQEAGVLYVYAVRALLS